MGQVLIGFGAMAGLIAFSIIVPLFVGLVVLWIVSYIPLVGRRGQRHPRAGREGVASEYPPLPPLPHRREIAEELSDPVVRGR
jgi:hypothetical protein